MYMYTHMQAKMCIYLYIEDTLISIINDYG